MGPRLWFVAPAFQHQSINFRGCTFGSGHPIAWNGKIICLLLPIVMVRDPLVSIYLHRSFPWPSNYSCPCMVYRLSRIFPTLKCHTTIRHTVLCIFRNSMLPVRSTWLEFVSCHPRLFGTRTINLAILSSIRVHLDSPTLTNVFFFFPRHSKIWYLNGILKADETIPGRQIAVNTILRFQISHTFE